jgi:hypothetical protein
MNEKEELKVNEEVVLSKYEGEPLPENEFERISIVNGVVKSHDSIEKGETVGPVGSDRNLTGKNVGKLMSKEVD